MDLHAKNDRLATLMETRLDIRGQGLGAKLRRARRRLPRHIRAEAALLVESTAKLDHPKLARQIDQARLEQAFATVERYLLGVDPWDRRRAMILDWLAGNAFNLLVVTALVVAVLLWKGFL